MGYISVTVLGQNPQMKLKHCDTFHVCFWGFIPRPGFVVGGLIRGVIFYADQNM